MSDLLTQLQEYGRQLDDEALPVSFEAPTRLRTRRPVFGRPWVIAVAAAAVTIVLIGAVAWLLRGSTGQPDVVDQVPEVPETWTTWTAADGVVGDCACSMTIAADGSVWVAGFDGVSRFDGLQWERMELPRPFDGEGWPNVAASPDGSVWVSGMSYLARYRDGTWGPVIEPGFRSDEEGPVSFQGLVVDHSGRVWTSLGDRTGIIADGSFTPADEAVVSIPGYEWESWGIPWTVAPDGALWFLSAGAAGADLRVDGDTVTEHFLPAGIIGYGPDGSLWMGGPFIIHDDGERLTRYDLGGVRATAFEADGTGWFLVHQGGQDAWIFGEEQWSDPGLYRLEDGEWYQITTEDGLSGYRLSTMVLADDGALWISTADGTVTRYQPGTNPASGTPVDIESRPFTDADLPPPDEYPPTTHAEAEQ